MDDLDVARVGLEQVRGEPAGLLEHLVGRALDGGAADLQRARAHRAHAALDQLRVGLDDLDVGERDAERAGDELRVGRLVALAVRGRARGDDRPCRPPAPRRCRARSRSRSTRRSCRGRGRAGRRRRGRAAPSARRAARRSPRWPGTSPAPRGTRRSRSWRPSPSGAGTRRDEVARGGPRPGPCRSRPRTCRPRARPARSPPGARRRGRRRSASCWSRPRRSGSRPSGSCRRREDIRPVSIGISAASAG